jgi:hypothetical protein
MTLAEYSMTAFAIANGGRVIAYVPQILRVCRDPNGGAAVSLTTWTFFTAANVATVIYALTALDDVVTASVFGLNAVGCLLIVALTAIRRMTTRVAFKWLGLGRGLAVVQCRAHRLSSCTSANRWQGPPRQLDRSRRARCSAQIARLRQLRMRSR